MIFELAVADISKRIESMPSLNGKKMGQADANVTHVCPGSFVPRENSLGRLESICFVFEMTVHLGKRHGRRRSS